MHSKKYKELCLDAQLNNKNVEILFGLETGLKATAADCAAQIANSNPNYETCELYEMHKKLCQTCLLLYKPK
jgi:hypothetical protein